MKKILAIIVTVCMLTSVLCITAFAADAPASDVVLRVSALKKDDATVIIKDYTVFEDGWNAAMELAVNSKEMNKNDYARVIVDIYADWNANADGEFTESFMNGKGFNWDAIYFQPSVRMTLNLNGHTVNRGLTEWEYNGEVMYIDEDAEVIINDGTITGGYSCNGAGGIHVNGANVTLNNVNIAGNTVEDDDGAGIAVYDGATVIMNGGSIRDNLGDLFFTVINSAGIYVEDSTAILNGVTLQNNQITHNFYFYGAAIYANNSNVTVNECKVLDNGIQDAAGLYNGACTIVHAKNNSILTIRNTEFSNNGKQFIYEKDGYGGYSSVVFADKSEVTIEDNCRFTGNNVLYLLNTENTYLTISDSFFTDNDANVFFGNCKRGDIQATNTVFTNNQIADPTNNEKYPNTFRFNNSKNFFVFEKCDLGNSTFSDKTQVKLNGSAGIGSMLGEGSLNMAISLLALVASITSAGVCISQHKKTTVPATANKLRETEDEE